MSTYQCPRCNEMTISVKEKFLTGLWQNIYCSDCGAKLCAYPIPLAILYFFHIWNVIWFFGMYHFTGNKMHFFYMAVVWVILNVINITVMPLAVMRPDKPKKPD